MDTGLCDRYNQSYTRDVKIAISLPDTLYRRAEVAARNLKVSRSRLYATALEEFLEQHGNGSVTKRLNTIYGAKPARLDPLLGRMQFVSLPKEDW
jgi:antitoxin MazE6